jgi:hypothetical protein
MPHCARKEAAGARLFVHELRDVKFESDVLLGRSFSNPPRRGRVGRAHRRRLTLGIERITHLALSSRLDPQVARELGIIAAHLLDEALSVVLGARLSGYLSPTRFPLQGRHHECPRQFPMSETMK